jgi:multiple sugar transport system permease protein
VSVIVAEPLTAQPAPDRTKSRRRAGLTPRRMLLALVAYVIALIFILPYVEMVISALRPPAELLDRGYLPKHFDWSNFTSIWKTGFGDNLAASLKVAGGSTVIVLVVALPAAYYSARRKFVGRTVFLLLVLATQMFQPAAMLVGIQREFTNFNIANPLVSLMLVNAGFNLAFAVWILNAYFSSIPAELEEAAMVDGTSRVGALFRITLPLAMPGIVTALIFTFRLGARVRRIGAGHAARHRAVRHDRGQGRRRAHRRLGQVAGKPDVLRRGRDRHPTRSLGASGGARR